MARLYANENFPLPSVVRLRELGHDVVTVQETGKADQKFPDAEVLAFATADGRGVLTINRKHFIRLHNSGIRHAGIVACTLDSDFNRLAERIAAALAALPQRLDGQLLRVNRPSAP
jgi:Domain of unknown function (DUF5615)